MQYHPNFISMFELGFINTAPAVYYDVCISTVLDKFSIITEIIHIVDLRIT